MEGLTACGQLRDTPRGSWRKLRRRRTVTRVVLIVGLLAWLALSLLAAALVAALCRGGHADG